MPRSGGGVYSKPAGTTPITNDTIDPVPFNLLMDDFATDLNTPRPVVAGGTGASSAATALVNLGLTATAAEINDALDGITATAAELNALDGVTTTPTQFNGVQQLAGRNLIINGSGQVNQRGYISGTATGAANEFTLDRWFVISLGQSLTFTGDASGRVMTAPAGGVATVIEGANIAGGTYVLNWDGTATATVGGVARTKGETFTLTANTNATVVFTSGTFSAVQLELGAVPTVFERRPIGQELALCQRYFCTTRAHGRFFSEGVTRVAYYPVFWPVAMRASPVVSNSGGSLTNVSGVTVGGASEYGAYLDFTSVAVGSAVVTNRVVNADAEITS